MSIGGEIKVVLTLDDNGFTLKTKRAKDTSDALDAGLQKLQKTAAGVEAPLAAAAKTMEDIAGKLGDFASGMKQVDANSANVSKSVGAAAESVSALASGLNQAAETAGSATKNIAGVGEAAAPTAKSLDTTAAAASTLTQTFEKTVPALLKTRTGLTEAGAAATTAASQLNTANNTVASSTNRATAALLSAPSAALKAAMANNQLASSSNNAAKGKTASATAGTKATQSNTALTKAITSLDTTMAKLAGTVVQLVRSNNALASSTNANTSATNALTSATTASALASAQHSNALGQASQNMNNVRGQANALTDSLKGVASMWGALKIEQGLKGSVSDASEMQKARITEGTLNLGAGQNQEFLDNAFDLAKTTKFLSQLDAVKARMAAIGSVGSNNVKIIDATLETAVKTANNLQTLGMSHGDMQNTIRNLYGVVETRQQVYDPDGARRTMELMQKITTATGGKVQMQDAENVLRMMGTGAARLSDDGLINLMSVVDQSKTMGGGMGGGAGVSRVGTSFKMFQQYALGKQLTDQAAQIMGGAGLLDTSSVNFNNPDRRAVRRDVKHAGLVDSDLALADPVAWLQKNYDKLLAYTQKEGANRSKFFQGEDINDERAQSVAIAKLLAALGIQTTAASAMSQAMDPHSAQRINEQRETVNNSKGVNQVNDELRQSYAGAAQDAKAALSDIGVIIGASVLPQITKLLELVRDFLLATKQFGADNPMAVQLTTLATAAGGAFLAFKGFTALTGLTGGVFKALGIGLGEIGATATTTAASTTAAAATSTTALTGWLASIGTFVAGAGRLFLRAIPYVGLIIAAWDLTQIIGNLDVGGHKVSDWFTHWFDSLTIKAENFWKKLKGTFDNIKSWKLFDDDKSTPAPGNGSTPTSKFVPRYATGAHGYEQGGPNQRSVREATLVQNASNARTAREAAFNAKEADPTADTREANRLASLASQNAPKTAEKKHGLAAGAELGDDDAVKTALAGPGKREFEDPFVKFREQIAAKLKVDQGDVNALLTRQPKGADALRADALTEFTAKWQGGDFDKAHDPRNRQWKTADGSLDTNNPQVKAIVDEMAKTKQLEEQKKALTFANERLASTENDLHEAMSNAAEDGAAKQTREMTALQRELVRAEERLKVGTAGWDAWNRKKNEALANRAGADLVNFSGKFKTADDKTLMGLLPFAGQRRTAEFDASQSKDLDQYNYDRKASEAATNAAMTAARNDPTLGDAGQREAEAQRIRKSSLDAQLQAEQDFNRHLQVVAEERKRLQESPMDSLVRSWQDTFEEMRQIEANWANNVISALVQFAETGKLSITKFVESMALDVLKVKLQETFSAPLKQGLDALTGQINKFVFPNASTAAGAGANNAAADALGAAGTTAVAQGADTLTKSFSTLTTQGVQATTNALGQQVTQMVASGNVQGAATTSLGTLANAAMLAAQALGQMGGGSAASGFGGLFGSLGSAFGLGGSSSAAAASSGVGANTYGFTMPAFANGGIMTNKGVAQLRKYASGGVANSPQLALYGEGSMPEAYVPLPDGKTIPVTLNGAASSATSSGSSGAMPAVTVNVINQTGNQVSAQQSQPRFDGKQMILDVVLNGAQTPGAFRDGLKASIR